MNAIWHQDDWIRVHGEDELAVGMAIQIRPCVWCRRIETCLLIFRVPQQNVVHGPGGYVSDFVSVGFEVVGRCSATHGYVLGVTSVIREGRLYKLRPDEPAASDETSRPVKARETAGVGR